MFAFISYPTADKDVAGRINLQLTSVAVQTFLAHEDIAVSEEWRLVLLANLEKADVFVPILSPRYYQSVWCVQESGIAAFRKITFIPLAIEGSVPQGFFNHIQSTRIDPDKPPLEPLLAGMAKYDTSFVIDTLVARIAVSRSYRTAEANFELIQPFINGATDAQIVTLLNAAATNDQILCAGGCATRYLPPLVKSHGHLLDPPTKRVWRPTSHEILLPLHHNVAKIRQHLHFPPNVQSDTLLKRDKYQGD